MNWVYDKQRHTVVIGECSAEDGYGRQGAGDGEGVGDALGRVRGRHSVWIGHLL
jgi:hypothetical protein